MRSVAITLTCTPSADRTRSTWPRREAVSYQVAPLRRTHEQHAGGRRIPQSLLDRDAPRMRGLGGDVPVLRDVRRASARQRREPLLVLELDALPGADARV